MPYAAEAAISGVVCRRIMGGEEPGSSGFVSILYLYINWLNLVDRTKTNRANKTWSTLTTIFGEENGTPTPSLKQFHIHVLYNSTQFFEALIMISDQWSQIWINVFVLRMTFRPNSNIGLRLWGLTSIFGSQGLTIK